MNDKHKNKGKGRPGSKSGARKEHQKSAHTASAAKGQVKEQVGRTTNHTTTRADQTRTSSSANMHARSDSNSKPSGSWMPPVALLFGVLGTLMSAILWSKLNSLSEVTTRAMSDQRSETSSKIADSQTQITASMEEKFAANQEQMTTAFSEQQAAVDNNLKAIDEKLAANQEQMTTALSEQQAAVDSNIQAIDEKVSASLSSFNEELRTSAQADKEEISSATAMSIQEFSNSSESELNNISTSFNLGIRSVREDFEKRFEETESKVAMMQSSVQSANGDQSDRILAEVEYLLRTSQYRVTLAGDVEAGVTALESANDRLNTLGDVDYFPVREQIDAEVAELNSVGSPDIEGLVARLENASAAASGLPLKATEEEAEETAAEGEAEKRATVGGFMKNLNFSVTRSTQAEVDAKINAAEARESIAASSTGEGGQNKTQNSASDILDAHLQAARLSALRADSRQFTTHMDNALGFAGEAFDTDDSAVSDFVANLEEIRETNLVPDVPTLGSALSLFEQINAKRSEK